MDRKGLTGAPLTLISERSPNFLRFGLRTKDPERDKDGDEASDMETEDETLDERKVLGEESIEL